MRYILLLLSIGVFIYTISYCRELLNVGKKVSAIVLAILSIAILIFPFITQIR